MSYSLYLWRFVGGEPAPMDETAIRDVLGPVTVGGMPATGFPEFWDIEAEDGGEAEVYGDGLGLSFNRFATGDVLDLVAELARRTGAGVMPQDCPVILTREQWVVPLTPDEQRRVHWDFAWVWGPPEDHLAHLFRTVGAQRFVYGTHWPLRLTQNSRASLDLLPPELDDRGITDARTLAAIRKTPT